MESSALFRTSAEAVLDGSGGALAVRALARASARNFQSLLTADPKAARDGVGQTLAEQDTCLLFADGLRFDQAGRLAALLEERSMKVALTWRLAALPTVTPTSKPTATPIKDGIRGGDGADFTPLVETKAGARPLTAPLLRERLELAGVEVLDAEEMRIPSGAAGRWVD